METGVKPYQFSERNYPKDWQRRENRYIHKKGTDVGIDSNTEVHFIDPLKIQLKTGQILISAKESETPFEIDTPNGRIRTNKGTVNIQARDFETIVTAVKVRLYYY